MVISVITLGVLFHNLAPTVWVECAPHVSAYLICREVLIVSEVVIKSMTSKIKVILKWGNGRIPDTPMDKHKNRYFVNVFDFQDIEAFV